MTTAQTKKARDLATSDTFERFGRQYTVVENERGVGGKGRSILAIAPSGEQVIFRMRATEMLNVA